MQPPPPPSGELPESFGPYRILELLKGGGMGRVYRALDSNLNRAVALKVPRTDRPGARLNERFLREARTAAGLPFHPNLCPIYEAGSIDGIPYLTMPLFDRRSLADSCPDYAGRPLRASVALLGSIAQGVAVLHRYQLVHRDVKPDNVLFTAEGVPVVVDFGLTIDPEETHFTRVGDFVGTRNYAPPEQLDGDLDRLGPPCDVYALGVILYQLLTGQLPFRGGLQAQLEAKRAGNLPRLSTLRPEIDAALEAICLKALAPRAEDRHADAGALAEVLRVYLDQPLPPAGPRPSAPEAAASQPTMTQHPADPRVAEEVLRLLREWGWEGARERLEAQVRATADPRARGELQLLLAWQNAEHGWHEQALQQLREVANLAGLRDWALVGQAFVALSQHNAAGAHELLNQVSPDEQADPVLRGAVAHCRGVAWYRQARDEQALEELYRAAELFPPEHFGLGRVLDSLGMVYAGLNDYPTALAFYQRALRVKEQHNDLPGLALTHGQLGRLNLDWGDLDLAEEDFRRDLELVQRLGNRDGQAQMYNQLGQLYLARGQAQRALDYLDESVRFAQLGGLPATRQAYVLKDRALAHLALRQFPEALTDAEAAEKICQEQRFAEGTFHARRARAQVLAAQGQHDAAERLLAEAAAHFARAAEPVQAARAYGELARVRRLRGATTLASEAYRSALAQAELSRRDTLLAALEQELAEVDALAHYRWVFQRVRGHGVHENVALMDAATADDATVLFLDLEGFTPWSATQSAQVVRRTLNQLFAALAPVLEKHQMLVTAYLGDGFMGLVRGTGHARKAVKAGLHMLRVLRQFNRPRPLLGWDELRARIGVCSGVVVLGNVGMPRKIDFTAIGEVVNTAARVQREALAGEAVCVAEETKRQMGDRFSVREPVGRLVTLKGLGKLRVWDVASCEES